MKIKHIMSALAIATCASTTSIADDFSDKLTAYVNKAQTQLGVNYGMAIAVVSGDKIIYDGYFGYSDFAAKRQVGAGDSFYIASATKPLTALATLKLANKGVLDLDKSLAAYFPEVSFAPEVQADKITIRHLMNHTSGLDNEAIGFSAAYTGIQTLSLQIERLNASASLVDAPFGSFEYTNLGYNIISMIIEREIGIPWQDVLRDEVFAPAHMKNTSAYMSAAKRDGWSTPKTYSFTSNDNHTPLYLTKRDNTMHAAGGVIATAKDMGNFVIAELNDGKINGEQVFSAALIAKSQEKSATQDRNYSIYHRDGYGYGWNIGTLDNEVLLHHFGGFAGTSAHVSFMPQHDFGVVILTNEDMITRVMNDLIANYAYDLMLGKEGADETAQKSLDTWTKRKAGLEGQIKGRRAKQATRTRQLSMENAAYVGTYTNDLVGAITVSETSEGNLKLSFGNMVAEAENFTKPETVRIELVPGSGKIVQFKLDDGAASSFKYDAFYFTRN